MTRFLFSIATALTTILIVQKLDNNENIETDSITVNEKTEIEQSVEIDNPKTEIITDHGLRRRDKFICPETGEQLQVRAVGGRPKKLHLEV